MTKKNMLLLTQATDEQLKGIMKSLLLSVFDGQAFQVGSMLRIFVGACQALLYEEPDIQKQYNLFYSIKGELEPEGLIKTIKHGVYYVSTDGVEDFESATTEEDDQEALSEVSDAETLDLGVEQIGEGTCGEVYVYYYPAYKRYAELKGESEYRCKIGMTRSDCGRRFSNTPKTEEPEHRVIGLVIKTDSPETLEKMIHSALILRGKQCDDTPGREWFLTSTQEVKSIYESLLRIDQNRCLDDLGFI